jgi:hypothetical protein
MHAARFTLPLSLLLALTSVGCGASKPAGDGAATDAAATAAAEMPADGAAPADTAAAGAEAAATGAASAAPTAHEPAGPAETKKDADALVLEITIAPKGKAKLDDAAKNGLMAAANERIHGSSKLALPSSRGVTAPRKVLANLLAEDPTIEKGKGLTVRLEITGVSKDGQCPLFSLRSNASMTDAKVDDAAAVAELRKSVLFSLMDQLEATAPTVKPTNNCTVNKK